MSIRDEAHYRLPSTELADWLDQQGDDVWWAVDGDPFLGGRIFFPCTGDELAAELRKINRPLLVQDQREPPLGHGESITARDLDALVMPIVDMAPVDGAASPLFNDRVLFLNWEGRDDDWALVEDQETTESERRQPAESSRK